jgi:hypothetical protein
VPLHAVTPPDFGLKVRDAPLLEPTFRNSPVAEGIPSARGHIRKSGQNNPSVSLDKPAFRLASPLFS